jgi:ribosome-associated protein
MNKPEVLHGNELARIAIEESMAKRVRGCTLLDLRPAEGAADFFLICEGTNSIQNKAIADAIKTSLTARQTRPWHTEGYEEGRWILLDYSDVVIHIMLSEVRDFYRLEDLWEKAVREDMPNPDFHEDEEDLY